MSESKVTGRVTSWLDRDLPLRSGQSVTYSSVIGVARTGQMRRDFLAYLERERAHPTGHSCITTPGTISDIFTPYSERMRSIA